MKDGFLRVAAATPKVRVADPQYNAQQIMDLIGQGYSRGVKLMVFPELCLTAYTCADLFGQKALLKRAKEELGRIVRFTDGKDILVFLGASLGAGREALQCSGSHPKGQAYRRSAQAEPAQLFGVL